MAHIEKIWLEDRRDISDEVDDIAIRFDWSNDRHHRVVIAPPAGRKEVATALMRAVDCIHNDLLIDKG